QLPLSAPRNPLLLYKDLLPILQRNCQTCHRLGEAAPMYLLTYENTRPYLSHRRNRDDSDSSALRLQLAANDDLAQPRVVPKSTVIEVTAWYDNSPSNPVNPDPLAVVHQGEQSWEEMPIGF